MSGLDAIRIENLCVRLGTADILRNLCLTLDVGRIHALIGPSGCGKSTLLKVLAGVCKPRSGALLFQGVPLGRSGIRIGYVPQNYGLLPWKTIGQNVSLPLRVGPPALRPPAAGSAGIIRALGLDCLLGKYPRQISGGQQQRAALARALIMKPDLLLMDEPFSALDAFTAAASISLFLEIWEEYRVTTLFITHNMREAAEVGQTILLMAEGNVAARLDNPCFRNACAEGEKERLLGRMADSLHKVLPHA
ncbi:MAG: ATP-binding cassette domain-containing protein [Deltaproteobacteria bacterium]|nr:ATP-binding cassette domain-containing protein [Deltaproteobacteria bacterium]